MGTLDIGKLVADARCCRGSRGRRWARKRLLRCCIVMLEEPPWGRRRPCRFRRVHCLARGEPCTSYQDGHLDAVFAVPSEDCHKVFGSVASAWASASALTPKHLRSAGLFPLSTRPPRSSHLPVSLCLLSVPEGRRWSWLASTGGRRGGRRRGRKGKRSRRRRSAVAKRVASATRGMRKLSTGLAGGRPG